MAEFDWFLVHLAIGLLKNRDGSYPVTADLVGVFHQETPEQYSAVILILIGYTGVHTFLLLWFQLLTRCKLLVWGQNIPFPVLTFCPVANWLRRFSEAGHQQQPVTRGAGTKACSAHTHLGRLGIRTKHEIVSLDLATFFSGFCWPGTEYFQLWRNRKPESQQLQSKSVTPSFPLHVVAFSINMQLIVQSTNPL